MEIGDYVTGKDRSYPRSIYKIIGFPLVEDWEKKAVLLEFISFQGSPLTISTLWVRPLKDFRLASEEEIKLG